MSLGDNSVFSLHPFRKALEGTVDLPLSRRDLLKVAGAGLAAVAIVPACGTAAPIDVSGDDASTVETPDMTTAQATPDLTVAGPGCAAGAGDVGKAPAAFMMDTATLIRTMRVFVCRDAMGLYAISSACTHAGCTPTFIDTNSGFQCPCHQATFDFNGENPTAPARRPLVHYELCVAANGHVSVDTGTTVDGATRLNV